jgi:hypothetical protein
MFDMLKAVPPSQIPISTPSSYRYAILYVLVMHCRFHLLLCSTDVASVFCQYYVCMSVQYPIEYCGCIQVQIKGEYLVFSRQQPYPPIVFLPSIWMSTILT